MERGRIHRTWPLALAALVALAAAAAPASSRPAPGPAVDLQTAAALAPDGSSLTVQVIASCPERSSVVEAVVALTQPQASGQASFPLTCIGSLRPFTVVVPASSGAFQLGTAQGTASVTIKRGKTESAQDAETVDVQPRVDVRLSDNAQLEPGGGAATIAVTVACASGANGQQSYVNVSQGEAVGSATYFPICDGSPHTFTLRVQAAQGAYQTGAARALTFANVEFGGNGFSGVDDREVQIVS
jgi:hypothetical protein